ncbi:hypothetical protein BDY19DRAFT_230420 [Irpex rosettiformis]|uniref:Uncharacterized protein n=1 Tax=Irpex rosettiformis TaxID=378272 RepID=A0ACB8U0T1_9APHY|nr:hypothetical protein BDY19DRAFT_230420 [Irpex rosettiformis]
MRKGHSRSRDQVRPQYKGQLLSRLGGLSHTSLKAEDDLAEIPFSFTSLIHLEFPRILNPATILYTTPRFYMLNTHIEPKDLTIAGALVADTLCVTHIHGLPDYYPRGIHKLQSVNLLQEIFYHLLPSGSSLIDSDWKYLGPARLVCRGWNTVALATPWLWSYIYPTRFHTTPLLQRLTLTKGWPLRIVLDYSLLQGHKDVVLEMFGRESARMQSITVIPSDNPDDDFEHLKLMFGDCSMYSLLEFKVTPRCDRGRNSGKIRQSPLKVVILPRIFRDCYMLHTLDLCDTSFEKGMFTSVKELRLSKEYAEYTSGDIEHVLSLLEHVATVTDLHLKKVFGPCAGDYDFERILTCLPYLQAIAIEDFSFAVWTFMRKLMFPESAQICINTVISADNPLSPWGPIAEVLPPGGFRGLPALLRMTKFGILVESNDRMSWLAVDDSNQVVLDLNTVLHNFSTTLVKGYFTQFLSHLDLFPKQQINEVAIGIYDQAGIFYDVDAWRSILSQFPTLEALNITGRPSLNLIKSLMPSDIRGVVPCPNLHTLRIRCLGMPPTSLRLLQTMLAMRQCARHGIKVLDLVAPPGPIPGVSRTANTYNLPAFREMVNVMCGYTTHVTSTLSLPKKREDRGDKLWWVPPALAPPPLIEPPVFSMDWQQDVEGLGQMKQESAPGSIMEVDAAVNSM